MAVAIPTNVVQHVRPTTTGGLGMNTVRYHLPNPTLPNNTILIPIGWAPDTGVTVSIVDDQGNTYVQDEARADAIETFRVALLRCNRAVTGTQRIDVTFTGGQGSFVIGELIELWGIADTPLDGHSNGNTSSATWATGSFTPSTNNGFIFQAAWSDQNSGYTAFTPMAGMAMLGAELKFGYASQCGIQSVAASITPTITASQGGQFISVSACYKTDAAKGTAPTAEPRIFGVSWVEIHDPTATTFNWQHPAKGDLIDIEWVGQGPAEHGDAIARQLASTPATDNKSNTYTRTTLVQSTNCTAQHAYAGANPAARATTGSDFTGSITVATADNAATIAIVDIICGSSGINFDKTADATGSQPDGGAVTFGAITPTNANGIVLGCVGVNANTIQDCTTAGWATDSPWGDTEDGNTDGLHEDNFWGHYTSAPASAIQPTCNQSHMSGAGFGVADWAWQAIAFNTPAATTSPMFRGSRG